MPASTDKRSQLPGPVLGTVWGVFVRVPCGAMRPEFICESPAGKDYSCWLFVVGRLPSWTWRVATAEWRRVGPRHLMHVLCSLCGVFN